MAQHTITLVDSTTLLSLLNVDGGYTVAYDGSVRLEIDIQVLSLGAFRLLVNDTEVVNTGVIGLLNGYEGSFPVSANDVVTLHTPILGLLPSYELTYTYDDETDHADLLGRGRNRANAYGDLTAENPKEKLPLVIGEAHSRRPWTSQPQYPVEIDWSNPLTRGLIFAAIPGIPLNLADGYPLFTTPGGVATKILDGYRVISTGNYYYRAPNNAQAPGAKFDLSVLTALVLMREEAEQNNNFSLFRAQGSSEPPWGIGLHGGSYDGLRVRLGDFNVSPTAGDTFNVLSSSIIALRGDGETASVFVNGELHRSGTYTPPTYQYDNTRQRALNFGTQSSSGTQQQSRPSIGLVWNRALGDDEIKEVSETLSSPWCVFKPRVRKSYFLYEPPPPGTADMQGSARVASEVTVSNLKIDSNISAYGVSVASASGQVVRAEGTPVEDAYQGFPYGYVTGGRSLLPEWSPPVGVLSDISLNTIYDARVTEAQAAMQQQIDAWAGAIFVPTYGYLGSMIFHTGGHIYFDSNAIYRYDIATRLWSNERPPATQFLDADSYIADVVTGWMWAADGGVGLQVGEPFAAHTYAWLTWIPPSNAPGTKHGYLYTPGRGSMSRPGQKGTNQPHKYEIGTKDLWTFAGSQIGTKPAHSFAFFDKSRNRVVYGYGDAPSRVMYWVDPINDLAGQIVFPDTDPSWTPYYFVGFHDVEDDLYIGARVQPSVIELSVIDPTTGRHYKPATSGDVPTGTFPLGDSGIEWVEKWHSLVCYAGTDTVWTLKAPKDPRTGVWQWSSQPISGTSRHLVAQPLTKFKYVPRLDLFMWPMTHNTPVQGFRINPPG